MTSVFGSTDPLLDSRVKAIDWNWWLPTSFVDNDIAILVDGCTNAGLGQTIDGNG